MIEINLLPKDLRKKKKKIELPKIKFIPIFVGVVALILSIQLILTLTLAIKKDRLKALEAKWITLGPKEEELSGIKKQIGKLDNRIKNIETLMIKRILWAKKLNDLSDSMIPGIWLTSLSLEEKPGREYLSIKGGVSSFGRDEAAIIGRFMKSLKENKSFFKDFNEIELGTMQQGKVKDIDVMHFSISCYFKGKE